MAQEEKKKKKITITTIFLKIYYEQKNNNFQTKFQQKPRLNRNITILCFFFNCDYSHSHYLLKNTTKINTFKVGNEVRLVTLEKKNYCFFVFFCMGKL